ncbi:MAG: tetratricopeptide repeat protein [Acidobacteriota bacterium]|nr:tetratricopeptide repeat protein [Blastocatellia bacterium]MDW8240005.1 tetratricopeptide repeat protein [Acidobacteriota bacterium]
MKRISVILCLWIILLLPVAVGAQESLWDVFTARARDAYEKKSYDEAALFYQEAMKAAEALGPDDPRLASTCNNLAEVFRIQKKYAEAEGLYRRALVIREKHLGKEHEDVALIINNLAVLYAEQGHHDVAELLYKRAIEIAEKKLKGQLAAAMHVNLAELYRERKNYAEAKRHYNEALSIRVAIKDAGAIEALVELIKIDEALDDAGELPQRWRQVSLLPLKARLPAQLIEAYRRMNGLWMKHRQTLTDEQNAAMVEGFAAALQELETELGARRAEVTQLRQMSLEARQWLQQQRREAANSEPMTTEQNNQRPPHLSG